ncbi:MAG: hypothetical protein DME48_07370 [Verrucomicrobia bacterium]|nr:MAG: hypothetical protein DME48_07370 [Verrucomicrobiota bacterium]
MKISFSKYAPVELLIQKQGVGRIISFVAIVFFAGLCGSYLLANKLWLLTMALLGIAGILLCLGVAVATFLNQSEVNKAPSAPIEENVAEPIAQWDYRPSKPIRGRAVLGSPSAETSDGLSSDLFEINNNVWLNDNSPQGAVPTFIDGPPETEGTKTEALSQTNDSVCSAPTVEDASVSTYD